VDSSSVPITQVFKRVQPKELEQLDERDSLYYQLAESRGWVQLKEDIQRYIESLEDNLNISEHDTAENIGFKFLAVQTAKSYLKQVIANVEDSYEAIKQTQPSES
jgi:hypothetical protein